ncbi:hypothetical protein [Embleya sp. NPDC005971]|uniref:hypothetical protein n=1 Tax=unclassified Embleya TaxID=2699296 RepID=UPI0033BFDCAF
MRGTLAPRSDRADLGTTHRKRRAAGALAHRGRSFDGPLLTAPLHALRNPTTGLPHLGIARFDHATFTADAGFLGATFLADAASGQGLTSTGAEIEMASRLVGPVLPGLAALAIRGRVER